MKKSKDKVVAEVRQVREDLWLDYQSDPAAFNLRSEQIRKQLRLKRSRLKPIAKTLQELKDRRASKRTA